MKVSKYLFLLTAIVFSSGVAASDLDAVMKGCNDCHGNNGVSEWNDMPTIAGIDSFGHADGLYMFRDEERPCAESKYRQGDTARAATTMCAVAAELSDDQIDALGDAYSELPFVPAAQAFDAELAKKGAALHEQHCDQCHSDGGSNVEDEASILAGQWIGYLEMTMADYISGARPQDKKMKEKIAALSADDVKAVIHFYASQQ